MNAFKVVTANDPADRFGPEILSGPWLKTKQGVARNRPAKPSHAKVEYQITAWKAEACDMYTSHSLESGDVKAPT